MAKITIDIESVTQNGEHTFDISIVTSVSPNEEVGLADVLAKTVSQNLKQFIPMLSNQLMGGVGKVDEIQSDFSPPYQAMLLISLAVAR